MSDLIGTKTMRVTIVMATYNCVDIVERAIHSVCQQEYSDIEFIVVDGASNDGTLDILKRFEQSGKISKLISEPDKGVYYALNKGIKLATGDIIGFLGSDDLYEPGAISAIVRGFEESCADVVYGGIKTVSLDKEKYFSYDDFSLEEYINGKCLCHQAFFVRTAMQKAMPFDVSYRIAADSKLISRWYFSGFIFHHVCAIIATYNTGGFSGKHPFFNRCEVERFIDELLVSFPELETRKIDVARRRNNFRINRLYAYLKKNILHHHKYYDITPKNKLIIWGVGNNGSTILKLLLRNIFLGRVVCLWDNSKNRQDGTLDGIKIKKPFVDYHGELILVASSKYQDEMCRALELAGLKNGENYWSWNDLITKLFKVYCQGKKTASMATEDWNDRNKSIPVYCTEIV